MRATTIKRYLPALLLYVQRRLEGGRDAVISVRTRDACGVAVYSLMMRLVEEGLAKRHKQGVYLIERALEKVLTVLRGWIRRQRLRKSKL